MSSISTGYRPRSRIEQKTTSRNPRSTVATVTEIYDYMRLLWARVGVPYSPATGLPIEAQTVSNMVDRVMALPEGTRLYLLAPVVRGRKGEYRKRTGRMAEGRLHPRAHRRRDVSDRGSARARQEIQARHRSGGRPHRGEGGHRDAPRRQFRNRAQAGRGAGLCRSGRWRGAGARGRGRSGRRDEGRRHSRQPHRLLREIRLPGQRLHHRGDRAAAVLLQRPARRLPDLRRAGREAAVRPAAGRPERGADASRRARWCPGPSPTRRRPITCRCSPASRRNTTSTSTTPWKELAARSARHHPPRHQGQAACRSPSRTGARNTPSTSRSKA